MPEFQLSGADARFNALSPLTRGYVEALFFTEEDKLRDPVGATGDDSLEGEPVCEEPGWDVLTEASKRGIVEHCADFERVAAKLLRNLDSDQLMQAGRDLWFTAEGHGVGFWDRDDSTYVDAATRDALNDLCSNRRGGAFSGETEVYALESGQVGTGHAGEEPAAYWFRMGDGNEGNFRRRLVWIDAGESMYDALAALVLNTYQAGSSTRRWIGKRLELEGEADAPRAYLGEGPRGVTAYGAAWLTAELEPAEIDADGTDYQGVAPIALREWLDRGALRRLGKPRRFRIFDVTTGADTYGATTFSEARARELCADDRLNSHGFRYDFAEVTA